MKEWVETFPELAKVIDSAIAKIDSERMATVATSSTSATEAARQEMRANDFARIRKLFEATRR